MVFSQIRRNIFIMKSKFHLPSCICLLFLLNSLLVFTRADSHRHEKPSVMDVLDPFIGTRKGNTTKGLSQLKNYLSNLGYMNNSKLIHANDDLFDDSLEQAIKKYQVFFKLPSNGILDADTLAKMSQQPRCGVPDFPHETDHSQSYYTFFPGSPKWPPKKRNLTYSFPPGTRADANKAIHGATKLWASVSSFKFSYIKDYDKADIKISFQSRDHGDGNPFDGSGGVTAHAFGPNDGRLHFDGDERWVNGVNAAALDIQSVGLHELGHVLGLGHSTDGGAIMYPTLGYGVRKGLGKDDINGIKTLYQS